MTVLAAFAQEESVSISENIAWSFRKKYEAGIPRRFVLFGYRLDEDGEYRIVGEEAAVVRRARNARQTPPRHASIAEYHRATALEALMGALYLSGDMARLKELMEVATENVEIR